MKLNWNQFMDSSPMPCHWELYNKEKEKCDNMAEWTANMGPIHPYHFCNKHKEVIENGD